MTLKDAISSFRARSGAQAARLAKAAGVLWKALTFNLLEGVLIPGKYLCVVPGRGYVSIAYGSQFLMKPRIKGFKHYSFDEAGFIGPEHLAEATRLAMDEFKAKGAGIVLALPRQWAVVRAVELPAVVRENITSVMEYELDRLTPFSPSEAMYDFAINGEENGKLNITLIAVREETVKPYINALGEAGMGLERITLSLATLGTLCRMFGNGGEAICLSIVDGGYEGCFMKDGALISCFSDDFSGGDREGHLEQVKEGLAPLLERLGCEGAIPAVFLTAVPGYTMLERTLGIPVRVLNKEDIRVMFKTDLDDGIIEPLGGLLEMIKPGTRGFDLISRGAKGKRKMPLTAAVVLGALVIAAMVPYVVVPLEMEKRRLEAIEYQVKIRKGEVRKIEALKQETDALDAEVSKIQKFKGSRPMTLDILKELTMVLPKNVWLTRARVTGETVEMEGYAQLATEILPKLEQSSFFKKVEFTSPTVRDTRLNAERFVIKMEIEGFEKK